MYFVLFFIYLNIANVIMLESNYCFPDDLSQRADVQSF